MAENLARSYPQDFGPDEPSPKEPAHPVSEPLPMAIITVPYRNGFNRTIRLIGLACLLGSALGLLAGVAGMPLNVLTMLGALLLSLILIGYSVRPSLRRPRIRPAQSGGGRRAGPSKARE